MIQLVYVAGSYAASTRPEIERNVARAVALARFAVLQELTVVSPHSMGRMGCYGHPFEADEHTRARALRCGVQGARAVGLVGGAFWGIYAERDGGIVLSSGTKMEHDGWCEGSVNWWRGQSVWSRPAAALRTWGHWVDYASTLGFDLEATAREVEARAWDAAPG